MIETECEYTSEARLTCFDLRPLERIAVLKTLRGVSFNEIADGCNISKPQAVQIFNGKYSPTIYVKDRIAQFFGVNSILLWQPARLSFNSDLQHRRNAKVQPEVIGD